jgi:glycerol-3-phosphate dehydrogenase
MAWYPGSDYVAWCREMITRGESAGLDAETAGLCAERYGSTVVHVLELVEQQPGLARRMVDDLSFCRAEIVHTAQSEMARTLVDILRRRIPLLILSRLPRDVIDDAAQLAGEVLGWPEDRIQSEVELVLEEKAAQFPGNHGGGGTDVTAASLGKNYS